MPGLDATAVKLERLFSTRIQSWFCNHRQGTVGQNANLRGKMHIELEIKTLENKTTDLYQVVSNTV